LNDSLNNTDIINLTEGYSQSYILNSTKSHGKGERGRGGRVPTFRFTGSNNTPNPKKGIGTLDILLNKE
jgi:hypothetical protein